MKFEIKHWLTGKILFEYDGESLKIAVEAAVNQKVVLDRARLDGARLVGARLDGASLVGASLDGASLVGARLVGARLDEETTRMPGGETWGQYLKEVLPALLTAGGKALGSFFPHWKCHTWGNCPMAHAFDCKDLKGVPLLLRPRAQEFITLFDGKVLPLSVLRALQGPAPDAADSSQTSEAAQCEQIAKGEARAES